MILRMTILTRAQIYKQWMLTVFFGSVVYTVVFGAELAGKLFIELTFLEKVHSYVGCLIATLLYSFLASGIALYLNRLVYHLISCDSAIKNRTNWLIFLSFPSFVSTVFYCGLYAVVAQSEASYLQQFVSAAKFLLPWILSALAVTTVLNRHLFSPNEMVS